jgi:hypothetical protein
MYGKRDNKKHADVMSDDYRSSTIKLTDAPVSATPWKIRMMYVDIIMHF